MSENYWNRLRNGRVNRRRFLAATGVAAAGTAAILAGCSDDEEEAAAPAAAATEAAAAATEAAAAGRVVNDPPGLTRGGTLRFGSAVGGDSVFDPAITNHAATYSLGMGNVYNRLLAYDGDVAVYPELAASLPEQPDDITYAFTLLPDIKWHDIAPANGRQFTAEDAAFGLNRFNEDNPEFMQGQIKMIDKIDVIDDLHFTVTTKSPFAPMLRFLADDPILMVNREQREAVGDAGLKKYENMVGTGPFMRGELEAEVHGRLDANPNYFIKGQPYLDHIEHIAISADAQEGAFLAGEFDTFDSFTAGGYSFQVSSYQDQMGDKVDFRKRLHSAIAEVHMHNEKAPFNDQRVRRAVQLIINRQLTANPFGPGSGIIMGPVPQMFTPFAWSEQELLELPGYREDKEADIKEAIALATAAGLDPNDPLTIATPIQCDCHAVQIKEDVKAIGLNLELEPATSADYFAQRAAGNYVMNIGLEVGGTDADTYLHHRFHSTGAFNRVGVNDPELDALLDKQRTTIDNEARAAAIDEVSLMLLEKSPQAFVSSLIFYPIFRSYLKGVPAKVPFGLTHNHSTLWLDSNMM